MKFKTVVNNLLFTLTMSFSFLLSAEEGSQAPVWIDVRTVMEHSLDSIEGDARISYGDIVTELAKTYPDKNTEIHLYCLSGGRAGKAMSALKDAGYTNVSNAGGISDARKKRGLSE